MRYCELRRKEVVNIIDGRSLGYISDLVFECATGCIKAIVLPCGAGIAGFFKSKEYIIPWKNIVKIGDDVILIEADLNIYTAVT